MESPTKTRRSFLRSSMRAVAGMILVPVVPNARTLTAGSLAADLIGAQPMLARGV